MIICQAQRLAAQPLGHFRFVVTIFTGNLQSQYTVLSLSLGQVGCSRVLGKIFLYFIFDGLPRNNMAAHHAFYDN
jgi:hypothetical protein